MIRTTLAHVVSAVAFAGSRPPGLLVVGYACEVLRGRGEQNWSIDEGLGSSWRIFDSIPQQETLRENGTENENGNGNLLHA